jgi:hypothetical protein
VPHRWDDLVKIETARITVPRDLAEDLAKDGFYEVKRVRGIDVQATLTLIETTVGLSANFATILVAKDEIHSFVRALRRWMTHHTGTDAGSELILKASRRDGDTEVTMQITSRRRESSQAPDIDMTAVDSLLEAMFARSAAIESHRNTAQSPET